MQQTYNKRKVYKAHSLLSDMQDEIPDYRSLSLSRHNRPPHSAEEIHMLYLLKTVSDQYNRKLLCGRPAVIGYALLDDKILGDAYSIWKGLLEKREVKEGPGVITNITESATTNNLACKITSKGLRFIRRLLKHA